MYFLNLSVLQMLAVFGAISAVSVALYLLDRSRRKQVVSTLRFWVAAEHPAVAARRRHINQPWSLLLQLLSMGLILLALAQVRFGTPAANSGRDHVIVLDTSAWMAARSGNRTLMDTARTIAREYLRAVPARDRVMLVRADALATPATTFEPDHHKVEAAILASQPGSTALNLDQALAFARHAQGQEGRTAGEIAFVGTGRTGERDPGMPPPPKNLRVLLVPDTIENSGLRKVGMRRSATEPDLWQIYVSIHNYGTRPRNVNLALDYGPPNVNTRTPAGSQAITLPPGGDAEATFEYRTAAAGILDVKMTPHDAFPADDQAELELPAQPHLAVTVYSDQPDLLRPVLSATPRLTATYRKTSEYRAGDTGLVILDRFAPPQRPTADSIWIAPPAEGSPIPVMKTVENVPFTKWDSGSPEAAGLRAKDFKLDKTLVFEKGPADDAVGEVDAGPVVIARAGTPKIAVLGFHPALSPMRYELTWPLLFANLLRWQSPEIFLRSEIGGGSVGTVKLMVDDGIAAKDVKVTAEDGTPVPFTLRDKTINFFAGAPGSVRVVAGDHEYMYALTLPQLSDSRWDPPPNTHRGIPHFDVVLEHVADIWPWLALLGGVGLLTEWLLYGRFRMARFAPAGQAAVRPIAEEVHR